MRYPDLDTLCSKHFCYRDIVEVGETWAELRIDNRPRQPETYLAIQLLCANILDPLADKFGYPIITYGFASRQLTRHISGRILPQADQHAGCELKTNGQPLCARLGQSVDFSIEGVKTKTVASWIALHTPFDRMYFYDDDRPVHVSVGPQNSRYIAWMKPYASQRRVPISVNAGWFRS